MTEDNNPPTPTEDNTQLNLLNREKAAAYIQAAIGIPVTTTMMANWASNDNGPRYRIWRGRGQGRGGRGRYAVYKLEDLDAWIESQLVEPKLNHRQKSRKAGDNPQSEPAERTTSAA